MSAHERVVENRKLLDRWGTSERVGGGTRITKHKNHQKTIETKIDTDVSGTLHCIVLNFQNF